jgi:translation elongation factor EF-Tu-like GTPase
VTRRVVLASLQLLPTGEGGRAAPIESGYRSLARFEVNEADFGFELELDSERLAPGESGTGRLSFWAVEELPDLSAGQTFELREGTRTVGGGTILELNV